MRIKEGGGEEVEEDGGCRMEGGEGVEERTQSERLVVVV